jgi:hypothetical protein
LDVKYHGGIRMIGKGEPGLDLGAGEIGRRIDGLSHRMLSIL